MQFTPEVVAQYQRLVHKVARGFSCPGIEHDDLVSCAWLRICIEMPKFDGRSELHSFISMRARYAMQDYIRTLSPLSRSGRGYRLEPLSPLLSAPPGSTAGVDVFLLLRRVRLRPKERHAIAMRYGEDCALSEIGERMGFGEARACQLVKSALKKLAAAA